MKGFGQDAAETAAGADPGRWLQLDNGISDGLIRFSIGLETLSDLKDDILQALDAIQR